MNNEIGSLSRAAIKCTNCESVLWIDGTKTSLEREGEKD